MNELRYPEGVMMGFVLQDGCTPVGVASQNGHLEIVKRIIETGANVNQTSKVVEIEHDSLTSYILTHGFQLSSINGYCSGCVWIVMYM